MVPANRGLIYVTVISLAMGLLAIANSIFYTDHVAEQNERKWCALVSQLDDAYRQQPPTTVTGRHIAADIHTLRIQFGCG